MVEMIEFKKTPAAPKLRMIHTTKTLLVGGLTTFGCISAYSTPEAMHNCFDVRLGS